MDVKKCVYKFHKNNMSMYNHFKVGNVPETTVYHIIKRYESALSAENKNIFKRKSTKKNTKKINECFSRPQLQRKVKFES